jgi:hypothetical protein
MERAVVAAYIDESIADRRGSLYYAGSCGSPYLQACRCIEAMKAAVVASDEYVFIRRNRQRGRSDNI